LISLGANYAVLGERDQAKRFVASNIGSFVPELQRRGIDPNACLEGMDGLLTRLSSGSY